MRRGFTLIEAILALTVFSVGIIFTLVIFPKGINMGREAKEISVATQLAQEKIEEMLAESYDDLIIGEIEPRAKVNENPSSQFYAYERLVTCDLVDSDLTSTVTDIGLKKVEVNVYWRNSGKENNVQIVRLINRP
jgi:prepilin-type N-terminal cleavage/methylation domain-containing protein